MLLKEPEAEVLTSQDLTLAYFLRALQECHNDQEVKLTCRMMANLIGPMVMGPIWLLDAKEVTKMMWRTHAKTQMAFIRGLIAYLPVEDNYATHVS